MRHKIVPDCYLVGWRAFAAFPVIRSFLIRPNEFLVMDEWPRLTHESSFQGAIETGLQIAGLLTLLISCVMGELLHIVSESDSSSFCLDGPKWDSGFPAFLGSRPQLWSNGTLCTIPGHPHFLQACFPSSHSFLLPSSQNFFRTINSALCFS